MFYVGLDIHVKHITFCVLDENGKRHDRGQVRSLQQMLEILSKLPKAFQVCFEASTGYGRYYEALHKLAARVIVAHPGQLKLIFRSKQKNDRADAEKLAKLLFLDELPTVYVPSAEVRAWRELISYRGQAVAKRTKTKNGLRALLRSVGVAPPKEFGLWTKAGLRWLNKLEFDQPLHAFKRDQLTDELDSLDRQVKRIETMLGQIAKGNPAVWQLQSIPGIGPRTAEAMVAFLDDPHRFSHSKKVGAYFGLVPRQDQSGGTNRLGHITKEGCSEVRHLVTEAVWQAIRLSPTIRAYFERIARGDRERKKIAVVATSHYLVRVMWAMLKNGTMWKENPELLAA